MQARRRHARVARYLCRHGNRCCLYRRHHRTREPSMVVRTKVKVTANILIVEFDCLHETGWNRVNPVAAESYVPITEIVQSI